MPISKLPAPFVGANDSGPWIGSGGERYYRQIDELSLTLWVAKTISDAHWLEFLEATLPLAGKVGRMPKVAMAAFAGAYPNAKQRRDTTEFLRVNRVPPVDRVGLLSDSPFVRGAITALSWLLPKAIVHAFSWRDVAGCLQWLREEGSFDERRASTAWSEGRAALRVH